MDVQIEPHHAQGLYNVALSLDGWHSSFEWIATTEEIRALLEKIERALAEAVRRPSELPGSEV